MSDDENENIFSIMCRLCLSENVELIGLYPGEFDPKTSSSRIFEIIERFTTVIINPWDKLPQKICLNCVQTIQSMLVFQNKCKQNAVQLHGMTKLVEFTEDLNGPGESENSNNISNNLDESETRDDSVSIDDSISRVESDNLSEQANLSDSQVETEKILEVNVDDLKSESDDSNGTIDNLVEHDVNNQNYKYPKWKASLIACHICGKCYSKNEMKYHVNKHNSLKPYKCDVENCKSAFSAPRDLKNHKKALHSRKPAFSCDICGNEFKWIQGLKIHPRHHFDPDIPCEICGKLFKTKPALKKHMLVHSQDRKYKCETCRKAFQTRYTLRIHKRIHTQEKPYSCHCGMSFAYKCLLTAHKKKYHISECC
ncbi:zinc finger imprinted 3-like [Bradysia coprophila]|uniref:zinc finger imprinted 3-like n=1 Tax=Bradysia coprophila TaxID=38358 RepID=UPI00187D6FF5|nr:zinc finger imprinted 3-like [Bradysia coprophila]